MSEGKAASPSHARKNAGSRWKTRMLPLFDQPAQKAKPIDRKQKTKLLGLIVVCIAGFALVLGTRSSVPKPHRGGAADGALGTGETSLIPQVAVPDSPELFGEAQGRVSEEDLRQLTTRSREQSSRRSKGESSTPSHPTGAHRNGAATASIPTNGAGPGPESLHKVSFTSEAESALAPAELTSLEMRLAELERQALGGAVPVNGSGHPVNGASHAGPEPAAGLSAPEAESLATPSLVYVHSPVEAPAAAAAADGARDFRAWTGLEGGTRLAARLETAVTTAVDIPVVAVIEYNYQRYGEVVVPAGSKVFGQVGQSNRQGWLTLDFRSIQLPGVGTIPINATALSLDYGALRAKVRGRKRLKKALVQAGTGIGSVAAQIAGGSGFSGPLDRTFLLRDRIAANIGQAGDQQLRELVFNERIVLTLPANTKIFVVLRQPAEAADTPELSPRLPAASSRPAPEPGPGATDPPDRQTLLETIAELKAQNEIQRQQNQLMQAALEVGE